MLHKLTRVSLPKINYKSLHPRETILWSTQGRQFYEVHKGDNSMKHIRETTHFSTSSLWSLRSSHSSCNCMFSDFSLAVCGNKQISITKDHWNIYYLKYLLSINFLCFKLSLKSVKVEFES